MLFTKSVFTSRRVQKGKPTELSEWLFAPLPNLFNLSVSLGRLPGVNLPNSRLKLGACNYLPVSLIQVVCQVMEG